MKFIVRGLGFVSAGGILLTAAVVFSVFEDKTPKMPEDTDGHCLKEYRELRAKLSSIQAKFWAYSERCRPLPSLFYVPGVAYMSSILVALGVFELFLHWIQMILQRRENAKQEKSHQHA